MIAVTYAAIAVFFVVAGLGGIMYLDHKFSLAVEGRNYSIKGRRIESADPFVRNTHRKFYALRVAYSVFLLALLFWMVSHVG